MNAPVHFAYANARLHALLNELWDPGRVHRALRPACEPVAAADMTAVYAPLVRWYKTLIGGCAPARDTLVALLRVAELENVKLLWRAAARGRELPGGCWRPLGSLATVSPSSAASSIHALVERLAGTPYGALAAATERSHGDDLLAAELALEGWGQAALYDAAVRLPSRDERARDLVFAWMREREADLLRRAGRSYGIEPAFAVGLARVLRQECDRASLITLAAWEEERGGLAQHLPAALRRLAGPAADWDGLMLALRRVRARACRRALIVYPYQSAPIIAAILLREEQARAELSLAAAHTFPRVRVTLASSPGFAALGG
jgi:hypothetical protein